MAFARERLADTFLPASVLQPLLHEALDERASQLLSQERAQLVGNCLCPIQASPTHLPHEDQGEDRGDGE